MPRHRSVRAVVELAAPGLIIREWKASGTTPGPSQRWRNAPPMGGFHAL